MIKRLFCIVRDFFAYMRKKNIAAFAASTAFFLFLSLIPMLMLLCALIPYTPLTKAGLMSAVTGIVPGSMESLMIGVITDVYDKSIGVVSVTAIVTLWSAGKGILALMRGLNVVYDVEEERNYFVLRLIASFYTVLILVLMILSLVLLVFGNFFAVFLESRIPQSSHLFDLLFQCRTVFSWIFVTAAISMIYTYIPGKKLSFRRQIPGAAMASTGWSVITWAFSVYIECFDGFNTYGRLAAIIVLMLWFYVCMYVVLTGAMLNRYFRPAFQFINNYKGEVK